MNTRTVTMARVYLNEGTHPLKELLAYLHDESRVCGVTIFRGISGFGKSGHIHSSMLLDTALDLPVVIEFFEDPAKVGPILEHLHAVVGPGHIVTWSAEINSDD